MCIAKRNQIVLFLALTLCTIIVGCGVPSKNFREKEQIAFVYLGVKDGNKIVIPNFEKLSAFKIYRKTGDLGDFQFVAKFKKPKLPMRYKISPYAVEWTDEGNSSLQTQYKIVAVDNADVDLLEVKTIVAVPDDGQWKALEHQ